MLANQEIFDRVAVHLLTQNEQCRELGGGTCVYRDDYGHSCAIGCLIPDEIYDSVIEGTAICDLTDIEEDEEEWAWLLLDVLIRSEVTDKQLSNYSLLDALQKLHDCGSPDSWKIRLMHLAIGHDLSSSVVDDFN
jgi:hypothetical protein